MAASPDRNARHLQLLAALVTQRRASLELGKDEAARKCGIAPMTYRAVEEGRRARDTTYAKIEKAFEFTAGACRAVLDGADSIKLLDGTELIHGAQIARPSLEELTDEVKHAVTKAAGLHAPDLTHRQTQEMTGEIVEELRRRGILPSAP
ncbi:hypothetical protein [Streptomyces sp. NPDC060322]|uniref:hypothetical protein n=1 Tax=Streptomyces sp. NPDC060322 TaxID=3347097 RepID=UPI00364A5412